MMKTQSSVKLSQTGLSQTGSYDERTAVGEAKSNWLKSNWFI